MSVQWPQWLPALSRLDKRLWQRNFGKSIVKEKQPNSTQTYDAIIGGGYHETTSSDETVLNEMEQARFETGEEKDPPTQYDNSHRAFLTWNLGPDDRHTHLPFWSTTHLAIPPMSPKLLHTSNPQTVVLQVSYLSAVPLISLGVKVQPYNSPSYLHTYPGFSIQWSPAAQERTYSIHHCLNLCSITG